MPLLTESVLNMKLPEMVKVKQHFEAPQVEDIPAEVAKQFEREEIKTLVKPGQKVALAVGSRGIHGLSTIVKAVGDNLKALGAEPFIVPAMGSHGGATAEGQIEVIANYGVTEENMEMPIVSSMEVVQIGSTDDGIPVFLDKNAMGADAIIPIGRVKPHTDFKGPIESGLCKMMAIGLGKHEGCSRLHQEGFDRFHEVIPNVGRVIIEKAPILMGVAILENAYDKTAGIVCVPADRIMEEEPMLLSQAKKNMPKIMIPEIDVLIVEEIGKDISGAGMDPNITGRTTQGIIPGFDGPSIQRIVILDLTEKTHGNAAGIGTADFVTKELYDKLDLLSTYTNCIASSNPEGARLPIVMDTEREAILAAVKCCNRIDITKPRIVRIKNTLDLGEVEVSETLLDVVNSNDKLELI